jgi:predicted DNA-binding ribbon-helix-helix protein
MAAPRKRSITIRGHRTSFSIEDAFLDELRRMARESGRPLARMVAEIDAGRGEGINLSSAIRLAVLEDLKRRLRD